jgi:aspartyl-tRNA(Asn)/glutamyl-tRNA(Gln) amidotransferase subunit C
MSMTREQVAKVAQLARLRFDASQLDAMTGQLKQIVAFVEQLDELDTDGVAPMAHASDIENVFAADQMEASLPRQAALRAAPKSDEECYRVPPVLGD